MKTFCKSGDYGFKIYLILVALVIVSCGGRRSSGGGEYQLTSVSYYADKFNGNKTASGEIYRHSKMTGAHKSLSFGTRVEIINIENNKTVIITINDRGLLKAARAFDLSQAAFKKISTLNAGIVKVKYRILK